MKLKKKQRNTGKSLLSSSFTLTMIGKIRKILRETWPEVKEGDKVLVYCTADTPWPSSLSHIFTVEKVELKDDRAIIFLKDRIEIRPPIVEVKATTSGKLRKETLRL